MPERRRPLCLSRTVSQIQSALDGESGRATPVAAMCGGLGAATRFRGLGITPEQTPDPDRKGAKIHVLAESLMVGDDGKSAVILSEQDEHRALVISYSRRDPAALNLVYCLIYALRCFADPATVP